jgi:uncharacterized protein
MYDPRYLAGIVLFNRGDFFEAHEVWESLWMETHGPEKPFVQGLIQAAVGLCHFANGNVRGAAKLYRSAFGYLERFEPTFWDLDLSAFHVAMTACFAELLDSPDPDRRIELIEERIPEIALSPEPDEWPDPAPFLEEHA